MADIVTLGKDSGRRSDLSDTFNLKIRQKGMRAYWSRAILCACRLNDVTRHADPSCLSCGGDGWYYVLPHEAPQLQKHLDEGFLDLPNAKATQCLVTSLSKNIEVYEHLGEWLFGAVRVTSFSFHKFAYRDRFTLVDGRSEYQQVVEVPTSRTIPVGRKDPKNNLRYPVLALHHALEIMPDGSRIDHAPCMVTNDDGSITFGAAGAVSTVGSPLDGALVTVVYEYHPVLIVLENVIDTRISPRAFKGTEDDILFLPRFVMAKPDYLPDEPTGLPSDTP